MSGHATAASEDLAAQNCLDSDNKRIPSESERETVTEIPSESERETVPGIPSKSERETVPGISSKSETPVTEIPSRNKRDPVPEIPSQSEIEPVPEIPSTSKREPIAEIPSKSEKEPAPEIPSKSERKPRLKKILTESERDSDAESDDRQQRLPGSSLYGEKPRRWMSEEEWLNIIKEEWLNITKEDPHVREKPRRCMSEEEWLNIMKEYPPVPRRWMSEKEWLNIMKEDPPVRLRLWSDVAIFKIPDFLKDTKREAYVPHRVSLGPYHHGSAELTAMDHYKRRALLNMSTRFYQERHFMMTVSRPTTTIPFQVDDVDVVAFANNARKAILRREDEIRDSYEESIDCDGNTLAMMLSLDGCFILEVLKTLDDPEFDEDSIFGENMVSASNTLKDMLMLENQIPWIVLLELLRLENPEDEDDDVRMTLLNVMVKGTCGLFKMSSEERTALLELSWLTSGNQEFYHLLGFVHNVIVNRPPSQANTGNQGENRISIERCIGRCLQMLQDKNKALNHDFESIPPAVELKNAGIKFRPCNGGIGQIDFDLDSSTIYLPLLSITDDTEVLFRNLIAFEMCRPSELNYVSGYVNLMDDLIDSQKDVAFLRSMGILTNPLGSDKEVAGLFNALFKGVTVRTPNIFDGLRKEVNANFKNRIANYKNRIRVQLALALAVAFAVLCLTMIQRIYTVKK